ncbi:hypothetical protein F4X73_02845 [Candidatus Poribacteria bacterium]|nr:hypothetical protein [Candidatus Poribacteria bacterium]MYF54221.1 hypothetical protein [Candidatus Poribacteria bacterium]
MSKFNPDFWEIPVSPEYFDQLTTEDHLWYEPSSNGYTEARSAKKQQVLKQIRLIIAEELTDRQYDCVQLYFYEGKTQDEIGEILGISRRVVSQHLFGVTRDGRKVGGAINKIRKLCRKLGVQFP